MWCFWGAVGWVYLRASHSTIIELFLTPIFPLSGQRPSMPDQHNFNKIIPSKTSYIWVCEDRICPDFELWKYTTCSMFMTRNLHIWWVDHNPTPCRNPMDFHVCACCGGSTCFIRVILWDLWFSGSDVSSVVTQKRVWCAVMWWDYQSSPYTWSTAGFLIFMWLGRRRGCRNWAQVWSFLLRVKSVLNHCGPCSLFVSFPL